MGGRGSCRATCDVMASPVIHDPARQEPRPPDSWTREGEAPAEPLERLTSNAVPARRPASPSRLVDTKSKR
jgi:hypothetical protein